MLNFFFREFLLGGVGARERVADERVRCFLGNLSGVYETGRVDA